MAKRLLIPMLLVLVLPMAARADVVHDALAAEMKRAGVNLHLDDTGPPYRMALTASDLDLHLTRGVWGEVLSQEDTRRRILKADVRVGSYDDDSARFGGRGGGITVPLPVDDDPTALRHAIWLGVDQAYKSALKTMSQKTAWRRTRAKEVESIPDYTAAGPVEKLAPLPPFKVDHAQTTQIAKRLSAIFKAHPEIQDALVEVGVWRVTHRYRDTEGNITRTARSLAQVEVVAKTQAVDGLPLSSFRTFYVASLEELPALSEMEKEVESLARGLVAQIKAPKVDDFDGPVLFEGDASAQLFRALLVDHLSGTTAPPPSHAFSSSGSGLSAKIGRRLFPKGWTVYDNPLRKTWRGKKLLGAFEVDEEGVLAERIPVVKNGMLKTLLMSRIPAKKIAKTNGHGRASPGGPVAGRPGNVILSAPRGVTDRALRKKLLKLARDEGYGHAYIVRRLADPGVQGPLGGEAAGRHLFSRQEVAVPIPVEMVRLDLAGRETVVRNAELKNVRIRDLRQLRDVSRVQVVYNYMNPSLNVGGPVMPAGSGPQTALPTTIVAPAFILPMVELRALEMESARPPLLERPAFSKKTLRK
jgi:hypothetical protein